MVQNEFMSMSILSLTLRLLDQIYIQELSHVQTAKVSAAFHVLQCTRPNIWSGSCIPTLCSVAMGVAGPSQVLYVCHRHKAALQHEGE